MLTVFLDSISINAKYDEKHGLIEDLLSRDPSLFKIYRTKCKIEQESIKEIPSIQEIKMNDIEGLNRIYQNLSFWQKNNCQEQFFFSLLKYAKHKDNPDYIHESVFVSENPIFFEKYLRGSAKVNLKHPFPNLTLLNLDRLKEVLDFYEMKSGNYYFNFTISIEVAFLPFCGTNCLIPYGRT